MDEFERPLTPEQDKKYLAGFAGFLIFVGIVFMAIFVISRMHVLGFEGTSDNGAPDLGSAGVFGDFIGGFIGTIFNLAGAILLFYTLKEQRDNFTQERLESKLYEMVKIHRDNVAEMEFTQYNEKTENFETAKGRKVFRVILDQYRDAWKETESIFVGRKPLDVYLPEYLKTVEGNFEVIRRSIDPLEFARIDLTYLAVFFGVGVTGRQAIKDIVAEKYEPVFVSFLLDFIALKPKKEEIDFYGKWKFISDKQFLQVFSEMLNVRRNGGEFQDIGLLTVGRATFFARNFFYPDTYNKYYGGHQFRLGHYYRHMFQIINFIDDKFDSEEKKKEHMQFFRAQLSTFEQYVYLFNSLSTLGRVAELEERKPPFRPKPVEKHLITRYNILRNIPSDNVVGDVRIRNFYPNIDYEAISNEGVMERRKERGYER